MAIPCHTLLGAMRSLLRLVCPGSVYCNWVRQEVWFTSSVLVWLYLSDGLIHTSWHATTLRSKFHTKLAVQPCHSTLTASQPTLTLTSLREEGSQRSTIIFLHLIRIWLDRKSGDVCWLVASLTSQQHASVTQGRICTDNFTCCHTEIEVADQTFYLTQSQYTDTGPTSPSADL